MNNPIFGMATEFTKEVGNWSVALEYPVAFEGGTVTWSQWGRAEATVLCLSGDGRLGEGNTGFSIAQRGIGSSDTLAWSFQANYSHDRYVGFYRASILDEVLGLPDVYEGHAIEGGMRFTNFEVSQMGNPGTDGSRRRVRADLENISADGFWFTWWTLDMARAKEGAGLMGQPWQPSSKMRYERAG